jgi:hypothetical protein
VLANNDVIKYMIDNNEPNEAFLEREILRNRGVLSLL